MQTLFYRVQNLIPAHLKVLGADNRVPGTYYPRQSQHQLQNFMGGKRERREKFSKSHHFVQHYGFLNLLWCSHCPVEERHTRNGQKLWYWRNIPLRKFHFVQHIALFSSYPSCSREILEDFFSMFCSLPTPLCSWSTTGNKRPWEVLRMA